MSLGKASAAATMLVPMPSSRATSMAMAVSSPVIILTAMPLAFTASIVALLSSRGGSNIGRMPRSDQDLPPSSERATASARLPLAASAATVSLTFCATSAAGLVRSTIDWGAPLATVSSLPWASLTVASVRLVTGSKGVKDWLVQGLVAFGSFRPSMTQVSIGSWSSRREASAPARTTSSGSVAASRIGSPSLSWFLVSVPVLSVQRMSTPAISSMAARRETMAFCFDRSRAPRAMVIEKTAGMATGIEATSSTRTNCRMVSASSQRQSWATTISR